MDTQLQLDYAVRKSRRTTKSKTTDNWTEDDVTNTAAMIEANKLVVQNDNFVTVQVGIYNDAHHSASWASNTPWPTENRITFNISDVHSYDLTKILDEMKIAIRSGHHCAQPLMKKLGISSSNRVSLAFYNTTTEIDYFIDSIEKSLKIL